MRELVDNLTMNLVPMVVEQTNREVCSTEGIDPKKTTLRGRSREYTRHHQRRC